MRASEAEARRLALVASRTDKAVLLLDPGGRVPWVNEAFSRWTGVAPEAARGRRAHRLVQRLESAPQVMRQTHADVVRALRKALE